MNCPKCDGRLYNVQYSPVGGDRVSVHRCGECHGVWFERDALASYLAHGRRAINSQALDPARMQALDERTGTCPGCELPMDKQPAEADPGINLDCCGTCGGTWTDAEELDRLEHAVAAATAGRRRLWQRRRAKGTASA